MDDNTEQVRSPEQDAEPQSIESDAAAAEKDPVAELQQKLDDEHDLHMRALASLDNLRKRVQKEREEMRTAITSAMIEDLLPILDHFELGLQSASQGNAENILSGFKMVFEQFKGVLGGYGLVAIDPLDQPFNPHEHECIRREYSDSHPENIVLLVMRKGYKIRDRLIRPAMVVVSTNQQVQ